MYFGHIHRSYLLCYGGLCYFIATVIVSCILHGCYSLVHMVSVATPAAAIVHYILYSFTIKLCGSNYVSSFCVFSYDCFMHNVISICFL